VHHPPENCQSTVYGLQKIEEWLGDGDWDVIHFNWGIWDAHHLEDGRLRTTLEEYETNLRKLVAILQKTRARLIWASTTPLKTTHHNALWVDGADIPIRNAVARKVMEENNIPVNDLYAEMLLRVEDLRTADGVHFTAEGSQFLAERVAESIVDELEVQRRAERRRPRPD
jgi:acyl-CoA thioesterase-1